MIGCRCDLLLLGDFYEWICAVRDASSSAAPLMRRTRQRFTVIIDYISDGFRNWPQPADASHRNQVHAPSEHYLNISYTSMSSSKAFRNPSSYQKDRTIPSVALKKYHPQVPLTAVHQRRLSQYLNPSLCSVYAFDSHIWRYYPQLDLRGTTFEAFLRFSRQFLLFPFNCAYVYIIRCCYVSLALQ